MSGAEERAAIVSEMRRNTSMTALRFDEQMSRLLALATADAAARTLADKVAALADLMEAEVAGLAGNDVVAASIRRTVTEDARRLRDLLAEDGDAPTDHLSPSARAIVDEIDEAAECGSTDHHAPHFFDVPHPGEPIGNRRRCPGKQVPTALAQSLADDPLPGDAPTTPLGCDQCGEPATHITTPGGFRGCDEHFGGGRR